MVSGFPVCVDVNTGIVSQYWERDGQTDVVLHALLPLVRRACQNGLQTSAVTTPLCVVTILTALKPHFGNAMASMANQPTVEQLICGNVLLRNTGQPPHLDYIE